MRVLNRTVMEHHELVRAQREHRVGTAVIIAELDLEDGRSQLFDNRTDLTAHQAAIGESLEERDDVE